MASPVDLAKRIEVDEKDLSRIRTAGRATRALQFLLMAVSAVAGLLLGRSAFADVSDGLPNTYPYIGLAAVGYARPSRGWIAAFLLSAVLFVLFRALGAASGDLGSDNSVPRYATFSRRVE